MRGSERGDSALGSDPAEHSVSPSADVARGEPSPGANVARGCSSPVGRMHALRADLPVAKAAWIPADQAQQWEGGWKVVARVVT